MKNFLFTEILSLPSDPLRSLFASIAPSIIIDRVSTLIQDAAHLNNTQQITLYLLLDMELIIRAETIGL